MSGTGDLQMILRTEHASGTQPSRNAGIVEALTLFFTELKKLIDSDEAQMHQWSMKAQGFAEMYDECTATIVWKCFD